MKKYAVLFILLSFVTNVFAQKIPQVRKELLFKSPVYWQKFHEDRLKIAPAAVVQKVTQFNAAALAKGYTFKIGYTTNWGVPLAKLTGGRNPDPHAPAYNPSPAYRLLPLRLNIVHISGTASDPYVDMRDYGIITPVRYQTCGSCWAHGTIAALETGWLLKNGGDASNIHLSEQQVVNCTSGSSCNGGWNNDAARFVCEHRIAREVDYMYTGRDSVCGMGNNVTSIYKGRRWDWVGSSVAELKQAIIDHGSVTTTLWASDEMLNYVGGVYNLDNAPPFGRCNHVVQMVGWDDSRQAWLIKNSWGEGWGEGGFGWIKYNTNYVGSHAVWIEAETTGDIPIINNNPYTPPSSGILFTSSDYNTLRGFYAAPAIYRIASRRNHKVFDCDDPPFGSADKGHKMQQWSNHGQIFAGSDGHGQEWFFIEAGRRREKPVYKIFNNGFTNFLQANASNPRCENGNGGDNQLWYIMPQTSRGVVKIKNVETNKFLQMPAGDNDGALIEMANESSSTSQLFDLNITSYNPGIADDLYKLMPKHHDNSALDLTAGNMNNGTGLQIWDKVGGNPNQSFRFVASGYYFKIHPGKNEGKAMEVLSFSTNNGGRVGIWDNTEGMNQDWLIIRMARESDKFILFNRNSGKCLDVSGVGTANGTVVHQWDFVNGDNQKWKIERF